MENWKKPILRKLNINNTYGSKGGESDGPESPGGSEDS